MIPPLFTHLCRLCLVKEKVWTHIFEGEGDRRRLYMKITTCLPVQVSKDDQLPKKICEDCLDKVEHTYHFRNITANSEKQLLQLLSEAKTRQAIIATNGVVGSHQKDEQVIKEELNLSENEQNQENRPDIYPTGTQEECDSDDTEVPAPSAAHVGGTGQTETSTHNKDVMLDACKQQAQTTTATCSSMQPLSDSDDVILDSGQAAAAAPLVQAVAESSQPVHAKSTGCSKNKNTVGHSCNDMVKEETSLETTSKRIIFGRELERKMRKKSMRPVLVFHSMDTHSSGKDPQPKKYECQSCGKLCMSQGHLKSHLVTHSDDRPFSCETCGRHYKRAFELKKHMETHTGEMRHICDVCGYATFQKSNLTAHKRRHAGDCKFRCELCGRGYYTESELRRHGASHAATRPFRCDICDRTYTYKSNLVLHCKKHDPAYRAQPRFQCEFCGRTFLHGNSLHVHRRSHSGENRAICDVCGKTLSSSETLKTHRRKHTGEKPFSCDICGKNFSKRDYLKMHRRTHTGERPHKCETCGKAFAQLSTLTVHKRYHTGIRPYACNICGKAFVSRTLLRTHLKNHGF